MVKLIDLFKTRLFFLYVLFRYIYRVLTVKLTVLPRFISDMFYSWFYYESFMPLRSCHLTIGIKKMSIAQVVLPHPVGIVVGQGVVVGNKCIIYQNVTIGLKNINDNCYPVLGDNVIVYAGATILGEVKIGNNAVIGAGCIVTEDVPPNAIVLSKNTRDLNIRFPKGL